YMELERPSEREPVRRFGTVAPDLYDAILNRCVDRNKMCVKQMAAIDAGGGVGGPVGAYNITTKPWQADQKNSPIRTYVTAMCTVDDPAGMSIPRTNLR